MSCSRMGYDLFTRQGWKNLYSNPSGARKHLLRDTLMRLICTVVGHRREKDDSGRTVCYRCCHYL